MNSVKRQVTGAVQRHRLSLSLSRHSHRRREWTLLTVRLECFGEYGTVQYMSQGRRSRPSLLGRSSNTLPNGPAMVCDATDAHPFLLHNRGREAVVSRPIDCRQALHTVGRRCAMLLSYHEGLCGHCLPRKYQPFPKVAASRLPALPIAVLSAAIGQSKAVHLCPSLPTRGSSRASQRLDAVEATGRCARTVSIGRFGTVFRDARKRKDLPKVRRPKKEVTPSKPRHAAHGTSHLFPTRPRPRVAVLCTGALRTPCTKQPGLSADNSRNPSLIKSRIMSASKRPAGHVRRPPPLLGANNGLYRVPFPVHSKCWTSWPY